VLWLIRLTAGWLDHLGPVTVFVVLFLESLGIPAPSEIVLLLSGLLVAEHHFSFPVVVLVGTLGSVAGAAISYGLAYRGGRPWLERHARWLFRDPAVLDRWQAYFLRHGDRIVAIGRVLSGVRMLISYPAGLFRMPPARFFTYTAVGSFLWPILAVSAGYLLGPRVMAALSGLHQVEEGVVAAIAALAIAWWVWRRRRPRSSAPEA
jgi:membrane protein DedA with SNARE-associated domain